MSSSRRIIGATSERGPVYCRSCVRGGAGMSSAPTLLVVGGPILPTQERLRPATTRDLQGGGLCLGIRGQNDELTWLPGRPGRRQSPLVAHPDHDHRPIGIDSDEAWVLRRRLIQRELALGAGAASNAR